jgi:formylglycine-generating enzyme required for sulfatase activity
MNCALAVAAPSIAPVPGGRFLMGSDRGRPDERPVRAVRVLPFFLGRTPVTNAEYAAFCEARGLEAPPASRGSGFDDPRQPVVGVTWFEATAYAAWLAETTGDRWRLPTEAEWERAARGGLEQRATAWGDALPEGEIPEGAIVAPWRVGCGTPNGYGLFDMGTIVHEWCFDPYPGDPPRRASRGGSWRHRVRWSPPAARSSLLPELRYADYGFRVLREAA